MVSLLSFLSVKQSPIFTQVDVVPLSLLMKIRPFFNAFFTDFLEGNSGNCEIAAS